jgi:hypothetical protein
MPHSCRRLALATVACSLAARPQIPWSLLHVAPSVDATPAEDKLLRRGKPFLWPWGQKAYVGNVASAQDLSDFACAIIVSVGGALRRTTQTTRTTRRPQPAQGSLLCLFGPLLWHVSTQVNHFSNLYALICRTAVSVRSSPCEMPQVSVAMVTRSTGRGAAQPGGLWSLIN